VADAPSHVNRITNVDANNFMMLETEPYAYCILLLLWH
jgi:hypothetical protein